MTNRRPLPSEDAPLGFADDLHCFVCGPKNPIGLQLAFEYDKSERRSRAVWRPDARYQGWAGVVHGGIVMALLDEAMVNLAVVCGLRAITAEMRTRLSRPARVGEELVIEGRLGEVRGRLVAAEAEVHDAEGRVAWAEGKLLAPKEA